MARSRSLQTLSATNDSSSPDFTISCIKARVSGAMRKPKRAANRATLSTRKGSSINAGETCRRILFSRSCLPLKGSIQLPVSSSAMALMVKSRLARSSSNVTSIDVWKVKPL